MALVIVFICSNIYHLVNVTSDQSVECLLRTIRMILAWHTSCRHIYDKAKHFRHGKREFFQFQYLDHFLQPHSLSLNTFSALIQEWRGLLAVPYEEKKVKCLYHSSMDAKVHAEAALVHWVATVKVCLPSFSSSAYLCFSRMLIPHGIGQHHPI